MVIQPTQTLWLNVHRYMRKLAAMRQDVEAESSFAKREMRAHALSEHHSGCCSRLEEDAAEIARRMLDSDDNAPSGVSSAVCNDSYAVCFTPNKKGQVSYLALERRSDYETEIRLLTMALIDVVGQAVQDELTQGHDDL